MTKSITLRAVSFILHEFVGEVLYFPIWWYTEGLKATWWNIIRRWRVAYEGLGLRLLLKSMGKPMYGDYSKSGRIISFFMRIIIVGVKLVILLWWTALYAVGLALWILLPLVAGAMLLRQLIPVS